MAAARGRTRAGDDRGTAADRRFLRAALRLARRGLGRTSPNPAVGAIVVRGGRIVGRGFTQPPGGPHAEIVALRQAGALARGATLYVTLEPCAHHGRTPPCVEAVRSAGIARLVIGCGDPNPRARGGGDQLASAGVKIVSGVLADECAEQIRFFTKHVRTGLPWVTLKLAASLDGRIATSDGDSRWITGEKARALVHEWRDTHDAILVGAETVRHDDPALTCRRRGGRDPLRVVLDGRLRLPLTARVVREGTLVFTHRGASPVKVRQLRARGVEVVALRPRAGRLDWNDVLRALGERGVCSVLVEGGGLVAASALRSGAVDRLYLFYAAKLVGGDGRAMIGPLAVGEMAEALALEIVASRWLGGDLLLEARLQS